MSVSSSRGTTLVELLVAFVLTGLLLASTLGLLGTLSRAIHLATDRWDRTESLRTAWVTTEREVRGSLAGRDWHVTSGGVLELRAFRGFGRVCGPAVEPGVHPLAWRGDRLPVAERDSLLVLGADGGWRAAGLTRWTEAGAEGDGGTGCGAISGERRGWMSWAGAGGEPPVLVRLFERGAYSFDRGAFRYERGAAGRQPLTLDVFGSESRYRDGPDGLVLEVQFRPSEAAVRRGTAASGEAVSPGGTRLVLRAGAEP